MRKFLLVAALFMLARPARAETVDLWPDTSRAIHDINMRVMRMIKPSIEEYREQHFSIVHRGLLNMMRNLHEPMTAANSLLELDFGNTCSSVGRFLINSTIGLAGLIDVAGEIGLKRDKRDFGMTLGAWYVPELGYLEVPLLGPSTTRDLTGKIVDATFDPIYLVIGWQIGFATDVMISFLELYEGYDMMMAFDASSLDSYGAFKAMYLQNRAKRIEDMKVLFKVGQSPPPPAYDFDME
ncbi:MAG: VacJ family lipoprotein [Rickettsiales bacterium]|jgi:phospholipid-binding lipoprotein MlaA|nr:VacJ family lipoprotein [Rickettsiales bacterium]